MGVGTAPLLTFESLRQHQGASSGVCAVLHDVPGASHLCTFALGVTISHVSPSTAGVGV